MAFLNTPMLRVQVAELKKLYKEYQQTQSVTELLAGLEAMREAYGRNPREPHGADAPPGPKLSREDLRLICFDVISSAGS